jgi:hypothetical protein
VGLLARIAVLVIVLALIWLALRFILRLARRVFACGCAVILLIGLGFFALAFLHG